VARTARSACASTAIPTRDASEGQAVAPTTDMFSPETQLGHLTAGAAQFITGMALFQRAAFVPGSRVAGEVTKAGLANAFSFDAHEGNLVDMLRSYPSIAETVGPYLMSNQDDSEAVARLKRGIEGLGLGAMGEAVFGAIRTYKAYKAGKIEEAAAASAETEKALQASGEKPVTPNPDETGAGATPDGEITAKITATHDTIPNPDETGQGATPLIGNAEREAPVPAMPKAKIEAGPVDDVFKQRYAEAISRGEDWVANGGALPDNIPLRYQGRLDFTNAITQMAEMEPGYAKGAGALDGVRSLKEVRARANQIADTTGVSREQLMSWAQQDAKDIRGLDIRLTAYNDLYVAQASRVSQLGRAVAEQRPGEFGTMDALKTEFDKVLQDFRELRTNVKVISSENARAQGSQRGLNKLDPNQDYDLVKIADAISMGADGTARGIRKLVEPTLVAKIGEFANSWLINSVLSMGTVGVKASTDLANLAIRPVEQMLTGAFRLDAAAVKAGAGMYASYGRFLFDALGMAGKAFRLGGQVTDPAHGHVLPQGIGDGSVLESLANGDQAAFLVNSLVRYSTLPVRVIGTNDEFTKSLMYRAEVTRKAVAEGADHAERLANAFDDAGHPTDMEAWVEAQKSAMAQALRYAGRRTCGGARRASPRPRWTSPTRFPVIRQIQPFIKVIGNIGRTAWQRTPGLNLLQRQYVNDLTSGGEKGSMALAEMTTGGALWSLGLYLANAGLVTGTLHPDPIVQKQIEDATGQRHSSIVVTNADGSKDYFPLAQIADPWGPMLAAAADLSKVSHFLSQGDLESFAVAAATSAGHALKDKNYLRGFTDFVDALTGILNPDSTMKQRGVRYAAQRLGSFMVPSMLSNKRGDDPYMREIRTYLDGPLSKLPGSVGVDPVRNVLGEPVPTTSAVGPKDLSPFQRSHDDQDPVNHELARQLGMGDKPLPKLPKTLALAGGKSVDLTQVKGENGFTAYDRMQELLTQPPGGRPPLRQALTDLFNSDRYVNGTEGNAQYPGTRLFELHKVIGAYHEMAQKGLLAESAANPSSPLGQIVASAKQDALNKAAVLRGQALPFPELAKKNAFKDAVTAP
jgi:hypothetical protein